MSALASDLWRLVQNRLYVGPDELARAIEAQVESGDLDFRTRLLIRDSVGALKDRWGMAHVEHWLDTSAVQEQIKSICSEDLGQPGFPYLERQIVEITNPETVRQFLRDIADNLHHKTTLYVGGSCALILPGYVSRNTQDLDVVDEVPQEIRNLKMKLDQIMANYRLRIASFQSHYLPSGWQNRVHSIEPAGRINIFLVDVYDIFLSKLFSARNKDKDDLRVLLPQLDKETLIRKLNDHCQGLLSDPEMKKKAESNWYILTGEQLPS